MKKALSVVLGILCAGAVMISCGSGGGSAGNNQQRTTMSTPAPTAVGSVTGSVAKTVIGKAGGSLSSLDSKVTISIPADALPGDTQIEITPLTNTAHGGIGSSYRLNTAPTVTFLLPVTLTFTYADDQLGGTPAAALGVAYQTAGGFWRWQPNAVIDTAAKTVTVTTTHFSDWSRVKGFQIRPPSATVKVSQSLSLQVQYCYIPETYQDNEGDLYLFGYACGTDSEQELLPLIPSATVSNWSVNGTAGGNATVGTVAGSGPKATYTAPVLKPTPDTVAVSAEVDLGPKGKTLVVANITVTGSDVYFGSFTFSGTANDGTGMYTYAGNALVEFALTADTDSARQYTLAAAPATSVTFTQWDFVGSNKVCNLTANAVTPFSFVGSLAIIKGLQSYSFAGALQAQGTMRCTDNNQIVTSEPGFPLAVLLSSSNAGDPGILPLGGDGTELIGSADFVDPQRTQHSTWHFSRIVR